jgi:hypothetical protein
MSLVERVGMSALCQKRTSRYLFDHFVSKPAPFAVLHLNPQRAEDGST